MTKKKDIHVVPHPEGWAIKREGNQRATKVTPTKEPALKQARSIAKQDKVELVIHNKEGKIIDKDSYGNDPNPPKDKKH